MTVKLGLLIGGVLCVGIGLWMLIQIGNISYTLLTMDEERDRI